MRPKSVTVMMFGWVEPAGRFGLALEAARELFLAAELGEQHLDRQIAAHHRVLGAVDGAHAADADAADDAVALADDGADERIGDGRAAARAERCPPAGPRRRIRRSSPWLALRLRSARAAGRACQRRGGARGMHDGDDLALRVEDRRAARATSAAATRASAAGTRRYVSIGRPSASSRTSASATAQLCQSGLAEGS